MSKDVFVLNGKTYRRINGRWADSQNMIVHNLLQREINREFAKSIDLETLSTEDCIARADEFKQSDSAFLAVKFYEQAMKEADSKTVSYILPRMTSCYRMIGQPQKAIDLLAFVSSKYGNKLITPALLTSAAAAYCDLGDYIRAKICCDRAYASGGKGSEELSLVYKRIESEAAKVMQIQ